MLRTLTGLETNLHTETPISKTTQSQALRRPKQAQLSEFKVSQPGLQIN